MVRFVIVNLVGFFALSASLFAQTKCVWVMTTVNTLGCVSPATLGTIGPAGPIGPPGTSGAPGTIGPAGPQGPQGNSITGSPCPAPENGPTLVVKLADGTCLPVSIIGSNQVVPSVLVMLDVKKGPAFYFLEHRSRDFVCTVDLVECMHGSFKVAKL